MRVQTRIRNRVAICATVVAALLGVEAITAGEAVATPAFARRYEFSCRNCHQYHYPRLNSFGRRFRENGYQLPDGAEDTARARRTVEPGTLLERLNIFKEVPLSVRGQMFNIVRPTDEDDATPNYETTLFSFLIGGGSIAKDVSMFFTWTPFPDPSLHQARIGIHNIAAGTLGEGTLNVRAGALFLLDFQRPGHRFLAPGAASATSVAVGLNRFVLDDPTLGLQFYGRPKWGPVAYELAVVAGDPGDEGTERDDWKDVFSRVSYILFYNTDHELRVGAFGYLGRSDISTDFGGVMMNQRDDFWIGGGDVELDLGPINLSGMSYFSRHDDALPDGDSVDFIAARAEGIWSITDNLMTSVRFEYVDSDDDRSLDRKLLAPHLTYLIATNALLTLVWRQDLENSHNSSGVVVLDAAF